MSFRSRGLPDQLLFFDALGGEFRPASDLSGRPHTLGRLALETIERGNLVRTGSEAIDIGKAYGFAHKPLWSPGVLAVATCEATSTDEVRVFGLNLVGVRDDQSLQLWDVGVAGDEHRHLYVIHNGDVATLPLRLDDSIFEARKAATQAAAAFFNNTVV